MAAWTRWSSRRAYYPNPDDKGEVGDHEWARAFAINVTGPYLVADEAYRIWKQQGLEGSLVICTSVNAVVPKAGSFAYDTSKAAANHLVRELAVAFSPLVRVNGIAPATVIEGSSMFPRERVLGVAGEVQGRRTIPPRARRSCATGSRRSTPSARSRGSPVTLDSQIRAITAFLDGDFSKTTGQIVNVDGGQAAAFLR